MTVRVEMLGVARVVHSTGEHPLKPTIRDQALAFLAYASGWVTRDRLGYLFWADLPDATARHNVRQLLKRMRRLTWMDGLESDDTAVRWQPMTDLADLRIGDIGADGGERSAAAELLPGLERGATFEYEEWLLGEREKIREELFAGLLEAARLLGAAGDTARGAELLRPLVDGEHGARALATYMELATGAGHRDAALAACSRVEARLRDSGMDLPEEARDLARRLATTSVPGAARSTDSFLVGRKADLTEIEMLLLQPQCRLLTLLGPGGIGKSTLADMLLNRIADRYTDGGVLVSLEAISDPAAVPSGVAAELGITLDGRVGGVEQLGDFLANRRLVLVMDNAEHLPGGWSLFSHLLESCPGLSLVVTSRERLRLEDEWVYTVGGLSDHDGVELFTEHGRRVAPEVAVNPADALEVCHSVGGSPLGLKLAAPWLRVMPAGEIAAKIVQGQQILTGGSSAGLARHRSIDATMSHSWELTSPEEREAIEALSVFSGPFTLELAVTVAAAEPTVVRDLIDKSLLHRRPDNMLTFHPLVRQHAAARLAADDRRRQEARARHSEAVLWLLDSAEGVLDNRFLVDDAGEAWRFAVERGDTELIEHSMEGLASLLGLSGRLEEGLRLLSVAETALEDSPVATAALLYGRSKLLYRLGRHHQAAEVATSALDAASRAQDRRMLVLTRLSLAWARKWLAGDAAQHAVLRDALPIARSLGDQALVAKVLNGMGCSAPTLEACRGYLFEGLSHAASDDAEDRYVLLSNLGMVTWGLGEPEAGIRHNEEAMEIARASTMTHWVGRCLTNLAFIHAENGDLDRALALSSKAEAMAGDSEDLDLKTIVTIVAGEIHRLIGEPEEARQRMKKALRLSHAASNHPFALRSLRLAGQLLVDEGDIDRGLGLLALVLSQTGSKGGDFTSETINPRVWDDVTANAEPDTIEAARAWADRHTLDEVVRDVLTLA